MLPKSCARVLLALAVCAMCVMLACGRAEKPRTDTGTAAPPPAPSTPSAQSIAGKTWDVKMFGDATGYRFDPASLTIRLGDGVRWTVVSGLPHNVTFWSDSIPPAAVPVLRANMPQTTAPLTGPLLMNPSQTYTISFGGAPAGTYHYYCTPHLAFGMKGTITVQ
ncbi:MAG TPA: plastocyanin/azurin family copper-binding protein [Gemmatimonadaceae bacterium]|nr:plastocyanin/azurin family copper-binding protein [Gemmatimonadaceae bacterium]